MIRPREQTPAQQGLTTDSLDAYVFIGKLPPIGDVACLAYLSGITIVEIDRALLALGFEEPERLTPNLIEFGIRLAFGP